MNGVSIPACDISFYMQSDIHAFVALSKPAYITCKLKAMPRRSIELCMVQSLVDKMSLPKSGMPYDETNFLFLLRFYDYYDRFAIYDQEGRPILKMQNGTFTSCRPITFSWYDFDPVEIKARKNLLIHNFTFAQLDRLMQRIREYKPTHATGFYEPAVEASKCPWLVPEVQWMDHVIENHSIWDKYVKGKQALLLCQYKAIALLLPRFIDCFSSLYIYKNDRLVFYIADGSGFFCYHRLTTLNSASARRAKKTRPKPSASGFERPYFS